jgi:hypothetical protein
MVYHRFFMGLTAAAMIVLLASDGAYAQSDDAKLRGELIAEQKKLNQQFSEWEKKLSEMQKKFEKGGSATDRQIALHISRVRENQLKPADEFGPALLKLLTASKLDNISDLRICMDTADQITESLRAAQEKLSENFGPRAQRQAHELLLKSLQALSTEQKGLQNINLVEKKFAKQQGHIRAKSERLAQELAGECKGTGKVGKHLERAVSTIQEVIKIQKSAEQLAADGDTAAAIRKQSEAIPMLARIEDEFKCVVRIAQKLEQQAAMREAGRSVEKAIAEMGRIELGVRDVATRIQRNANKKPNQDNRIDSLKLGDAVQRVERGLNKCIGELDAAGNNALRDGLGLMRPEIRTLQIRLEHIDVEDETLTLPKKTLGILEKARKAIQATQEFLADFETGELSEPAFRDVHVVAQELEKFSAGQHRIRMRLSEVFGISRGPQDLIEPEKK